MFQKLNSILGYKDFWLEDVYAVGFAKHQNPCIRNSTIEQEYYKFWLRRFNDGTFHTVGAIAAEVDKYWKLGT